MAKKSRKISQKRKLSIYRYFITEIERHVNGVTQYSKKRMIEEIQLSCKAAYIHADEWKTARDYARKTKLF